MEKLIKDIGGRTCHIYEYGEPTAIMIQPVDDHDIEVLDSEAAHIAELAKCGFLLVAFKVNDWNKELSPWPAPAVFGDADFGSGADETLGYVLDELLPEIEEKYCGVHLRTSAGATSDARFPVVNDARFPVANDTDLPAVNDAGLPVANEERLPLFIGGYSLAGFFALWAAYQTKIFAGVAAASPSVWFPGWIEYAEASSINAERVYLSLGDKEERTRNPVMRTVGDNLRRQNEILANDAGCCECTLEMNPGNHFKEPDRRTAKGFAWLMKQ